MASFTSKKKKEDDKKEKIPILFTFRVYFFLKEAKIKCSKMKWKLLQL